MDLYGTTGSDTLTGGAGPDTINDGGDNDLLIGGGGNDSLYVSHGYGSAPGAATLDGGDGDDMLNVVGGPGARITARLIGGEGADTLILNTYVTGTIDGGGGDDTVRLSDPQGVQITLGAGADQVWITHETSWGGIMPSVTISDFQTGVGGDRLESELTGLLAWWDQRNPFAAGYMRLVQQGADTVLQVDVDAGRTEFGGFQDMVRFLNTQASALTAENLFGYPPDGTPPPGKAIAGTDGSDNIFGTIGADTITAGAGEDYIHPLAGDDMVHGGDGGDWIVGDGNDMIYGDAGDDRLYLTPEYGVARGTVDGGDGADSIELHFNGLPDQASVAFGGAGNDTITAEWEGQATIDAGAGDDRIVLHSFANTAVLTLGGGADVVRFEFAVPDDDARSGARITDFQPGPGGDHLEIADFLQAVLPTWDRTTNPFEAGLLRLTQAGADAVLQMKSGAEWRDFVIFQNTSAASLTAANLGGWAADGSEPPGLNLTGGPGSELLAGGIGPDTLSGGAGADTLKGGAGDDRIDGGDDGDTIDPGYGRDTVHGGPGNDFISDNDGGVGSQFFGDEGDDVLNLFSFASASTGATLLDGGAGDDRLLVSASPDPGCMVQLYGGDGGDYIYLSSAGAATIDGGAGDDDIRLDGQFGQVQVTLGAGADTLQVWPLEGADHSITVTDFGAADRLNFLGFTISGRTFEAMTMRLVQSGGDTLVQTIDDAYAWNTLLRLAGVDAHSLTAANFKDGQAPVVWQLGGAASEVFSLSDGAPPLSAGAGDDTIAAAGAGHTYLRGDEGNDSITGGAGFDDINGNPGDDTVHGGAGRDWVLGGKGNDQLHGDEGDDTVYGNLGADTCDGGDGADIVRGGQGDDMLAGGPGNDWLSGDRGDDTITGGAGADIFRTFGGCGLDRVTDFSVAEGDRVQIDPGTVYSVRQSGGDTLIDMGGGNQLILVGAQATGLPQGWIFEA